MPHAIPLHHPTAAELHAAHAVYQQNEQREYTYRVARHMVSSDGLFTSAEAIHLLLNAWNRQSSYTRALTVDMAADLLTGTAVQLEAFEGRPIATITDAELQAVGELYSAFRDVLGPVGAAKALGLLHPRTFPIWDTPIAIAYLGHKWKEQLAPAAHYTTFMKYCAEQCTTAVTEAQFGESLLKTLDEWNFCIWTKEWLPRPA